MVRPMCLDNENFDVDTPFRSSSSVGREAAKAARADCSSKQGSSSSSLYRKLLQSTAIAGAAFGRRRSAKENAQPATNRPTSAGGVPCTKELQRAAGGSGGSGAAAASPMASRRAASPTRPAAATRPFSTQLDSDWRDELGEVREEVKGLRDAFLRLQEEHQELRGVLRDRSLGSNAIEVESFVDSRYNPSLSTALSFASGGASSSYAMGSTVVVKQDRQDDVDIFGNILHQCIGVQPDLRAHEAVLSAGMALPAPPSTPKSQVGRSLTLDDSQLLPTHSRAQTFEDLSREGRHQAMMSIARPRRLTPPPPEGSLVSELNTSAASDSRPASPPPPEPPMPADMQAAPLGAMTRSPYDRETPMRKPVECQQHRSKAKSRARGTSVMRPADRRLSSMAAVTETEEAVGAAQTMADTISMSKPTSPGAPRFGSLAEQSLTPSRQEMFSPDKQPLTDRSSFDECSEAMPSPAPEPPALHTCSSFSMDASGHPPASRHEQGDVYVCQPQPEAQLSTLNTARSQQRREGGKSPLNSSVDSAPLALPFPECDSFVEKASAHGVMSPGVQRTMATE